MERDRKNATLFADTTDFMYYFGTMYVREEIVKEAPDVAQALVDMFVETVLYSRYQPKQVAEFLKKDPVLEPYPLELIQAQNEMYVNQLKPTWTYPFVNYIAVEGDRVARWLFQGGRIKAEAAEDFKAYLVPTFMDATPEAGWGPTQPPYSRRHDGRDAAELGQDRGAVQAACPTRDARPELPDAGDLVSRGRSAADVRVVGDAAGCDGRGGGGRGPLWRRLRRVVLPRRRWRPPR
jgi:hypothetical protein